ncbi:MAG: glpK [Bacteriovoracaceae bacterium]|nr:glpK [Bacteriovoracaceae bacterium]
MILGIDQGTTGSTALLLSNKGKFLGSFTSAVPQHYPKPGWVEHDPEEIWRSVAGAVRGVLKKTGLSPHKILAIGITNQRETVSLFDGTRPLHRFIVWQDRRTTEMCETLAPHQKLVRKKSGLPIDPYFSATKIRWLLNKLKISRAPSSLRFRTIDSFLLSRLTGADVMEATNASRTSLMNLANASWDSDLFEIFKIPKTLAPKIIPSEGFDLKTKDVGFLPDGIPICAALGDQQAALFGQLGWSAGSGKITYGTGSFILLNTGEKPVFSKNNLVSTLAIQWKNQKSFYALEGSAFICGAWIQWLRDELQMLKRSDESETLAEKVGDSGGVFVIPALSGMGAPFWKPRLRGAILGLTRGSNKSHIARASLEALCFLNRALVEAMTKDVPKVRPSWKVDGGAVKNNLLLQIQADVLGSSIIRPKNLEATATGAALLAGFSKKIFSLDGIENTWKMDREFNASSLKFKSYDSKFNEWVNAIERLS